ncbi:MAG: hypothetical protein WD049_06095 [Candidatus Paceibacterota bacterium]
MKHWLKENVALVIVLALPVLLILGILVSIYVPRLFAPEPQYDFLYGVRSDLPHTLCTIEYAVEGGGLVETLRSDRCDEGQDPTASRTLYRYRVGDFSSERVSVEEARLLTLDPHTAPDGYRVTREYGHRGIFEVFGSRSGSEWYLVRDGVRRSIELASSDRYYSSDVVFYGWIIQD